jgi:hypothetical protein
MDALLYLGLSLNQPLLEFLEAVHGQFALLRGLAGVLLGRVIAFLEFPVDGLLDFQVILKQHFGVLGLHFLELSCQLLDITTKLLNLRLVQIGPSLALPNNFFDPFSNF